MDAMDTLARYLCARFHEGLAEATKSEELPAIAEWMAKMELSDWNRWPGGGPESREGYEHALRLLAAPYERREDFPRDTEAQTPSTGRTVHYLDDGTPYLAWKDDGIVGVSALAESTIALADGAPAYDEGNMYKDLFRDWPERVQGPGS